MWQKSPEMAYNPIIYGGFLASPPEIDMLVWFHFLRYRCYLFKGYLSSGLQKGGFCRSEELYTPHSPIKIREQFFTLLQIITFVIGIKLARWQLEAKCCGSVEKPREIVIGSQQGSGRCTFWHPTHCMSEFLLQRLSVQWMEISLPYPGGNCSNSGTSLDEKSCREARVHLLLILLEMRTLEMYHPIRILWTWLDEGWMSCLQWEYTK